VAEVVMMQLMMVQQEDLVVEVEKLMVKAEQEILLQLVLHKVILVEPETLLV
jgi:hypothetical protein